MSRKIDLADPAQVESVKQKQIKARARWFLELAIDNALAAYDGDGKTVAEIATEMIEHMRQ